MTTFSVRMTALIVGVTALNGRTLCCAACGEREGQDPPLHSVRFRKAEVISAFLCRFMGLYRVDVQNDQQDIVIMSRKITHKLGFKLFLDFFKKRLDFCVFTQYNLNVR